MIKFVRNQGKSQTLVQRGSGRGVNFMHNENLGTPKSRTGRQKKNALMLDSHNHGNGGANNDEVAKQIIEIIQTVQNH